MPSQLTFAPVGPATPVILVAKGGPVPAPHDAWAKTAGFAGKAGEVALIRNADGTLTAVLAGLGDAQDGRRRRFVTSAIAAGLPKGTYALQTDLTGAELDEAALGWLLAGYSFDRYKSGGGSRARLISPEGIDTHRIEVMAAGEGLIRDLVNTPASDMGPDQLEQAARDLAAQHGAAITVTTGDDLLTANHPLIHTVGRTAAQAPRLIDLAWGSDGPALTLVGKGVCFDTGGLNLKPGGSMGLMKKDMGGAANVLGLAHMIMALNLPLRLRVLIPAVENAIGGPAFRPGDVLTSRKGLTVEINNTDAEGRLVLADALALACEAPDPGLVISMATLTGAARVALGPDLAPYYATHDRLAAALDQGAVQGADPVWRMPFWDPYEAMIEPKIADLDNAPSGGFAGSITAALFLRRFVDQATPYVHFDIYSWRPSDKPGAPKGGLGQGPRAILHALPDLLNL